MNESNFKLGQDFVTKVTSDQDAPDCSVIGVSAAQPTIEDVYMLKYISTLIDFGLDPASAHCVYEAGEHDYSIDGADAAQDEVNCWGDDGDLA